MKSYNLTTKLNDDHNLPNPAHEGQGITSDRQGLHDKNRGSRLRQAHQADHGAAGLQGGHPNQDSQNRPHKAGTGLRMKKYSKSSKYALKRGRSGKLRYHRRLPKSSKFADPRSKQAIARDKSINAQQIYPNTPYGRRMWKLNPDRSDLMGYDTVYTRVKALQKKKKTYYEKKRYETIRGYTGLTGVEEHHLLEIVRRHVSDPQSVDIKALIDPELDYSENKEIIMRAVSPTFRDYAHLM
jgi:hypothetical protein